MSMVWRWYQHASIISGDMFTSFTDLSAVGTCLRAAPVCLQHRQAHRQAGRRLRLTVSPLRNAKSLKDIEEYPLEDVSQWDDSHLADEVTAAHAAGKVVVGGVGHMYETAWQIRGYEQFLMDTIERPMYPPLGGLGGFRLSVCSSALQTII